MSSAKTLKKLRSASSAFLEDGGSLLHGVDGLLREIQQTLDNLQQREQALVEQEIALETREACVNDLLSQLSEKISSIAAPQSTSMQSLSSLTPATPATLSTLASATSPEAKLEMELSNLQSAVTDVVNSATANSDTAPHSTPRFTNHRKKRRR